MNGLISQPPFQFPLLKMRLCVIRMECQDGLLIAVSFTAVMGMNG